MNVIKGRYEGIGKPSPTETHRYEFAADKTLGLFTYHIKRIGLIIGALIVIIVLIIVLYLTLR